MQTELAKSVKKRGFSDVRHADNHHAGTRERIFSDRMLSSEVENFADRSFIFVVGEEDIRGPLPSFDKVFSLPDVSLLT